MKKTVCARALPLALGALVVVCSAAIAKHMTSSSSHAGHKVVRPGSIKWMPAPPVLPKGAMVAVLTGNPEKPGMFTIRLKGPNGYIVPPHWHSMGEYVTVISGTFHLGAGDKFDKAKSETLGVGSFAYLPARMHHFAWCEGETVVQLHGIGPFDIHYIHASDNPLHKR
jgi:hypothetical protein